MFDHKIIVLTGPSGVGKSVLVQRLVQAGLLKKCITCTTRSPRVHEKDGIDYHFLSEADFQEAKRLGAFIETNAHYDNLYGVRYSDIQQLLKVSHVVILLNWEGEKKLEASYDHVTTIFIEPPSLTVLEERLSGRDDVARMQYAKEDMAHANQFKHRLKNDDLEIAFEALQGLVENILQEK